VQKHRSQKVDVGGNQRTQVDGRKPMPRFAVIPPRGITFLAFRGRRQEPSIGRARAIQLYDGLNPGRSLFSPFPHSYFHLWLQGCVVSGEAGEPSFAESYTNHTYLIDPHGDVVDMHGFNKALPGGRMTSSSCLSPIPDDVLTDSMPYIYLSHTRNDLEFPNHRTATELV
jgi:hypothetical protein